MSRLKLLTLATLLVVMSVLPCGIGQTAPVPPGSYVVDNTPGSPGNGYYIPDYFQTPNWANSPPLAKFKDPLPPLGCTDVTSNTEKCIPVAVPNQAIYDGSDYYEIELVQYRENLHTDLPAVVIGGALGKMDPLTTGGTLLRGYRQTNVAGGFSATALSGTCDHCLEVRPELRARRSLADGGTNGRPVRIKFTNALPTGDPGKLFVPVDTTIMGSGPYEIDYDPVTNASAPLTSGMFAQNRATLHLHGGRTPWISDGTAHQWITPRQKHPQATARAPAWNTYPICGIAARRTVTPAVSRKGRRSLRAPARLPAR